MILNYFKIVIRSLLKGKTFSLINIAGLALGLSCFTIIMLYVENELSYDSFHREPERIVRVVKDFVNSDGTTIPDPQHLQHWQKRYVRSCLKLNM